MTSVCVLGMHRSGTSLVARLLNLLGVDLGPPDLVARAGDDNPAGYWEHPAFVEINNAILASFGGRWDLPPAMPPDWPRDRRLAALRTRASSVVGDFADRPLWGWKDPRTGLTLPFWQRVTGGLRYVFCLRNPCAVAASLERRNAIGPEEADWLWLLYTQASLEATTGAPTLFISYEDLLTDCPAGLRRLAAFIGRPSVADDGAVRDAAGAFVQAELCHHRHTAADLDGDDRVSASTRTLYLALLDRARRAPEASGAADAVEIGPRAPMTLAALTGQRDRLAAEVLSLRSEVTYQAQQVELARLQLAAIHRSRAWRLASFLLRAAGRVS